MKNDAFVRDTVVPTTIATAVLVLVSRIPFSAENVVSFGTVLVIAAIAALEYGFIRKA